MEIIIFILIYTVGIFVAIALSTYLWADELDGKEEFIAFFSALSWAFVAAILLVFIVSAMWICVIKYPFVWFYNKCKERFKDK